MFTNILEVDKPFFSSYIYTELTFALGPSESEYVLYLKWTSYFIILNKILFLPKVPIKTGMEIVATFNRPVICP